MGFIDFFKKIGILKTGSGSWSGNVKDQKASDVLGEYYSEEKKDVENKNEEDVKRNESEM